jgi:hypothetical protein
MIQNKRELRITNLQGCVFWDFLENGRRVTMRDKIDVRYLCHNLALINENHVARKPKNLKKSESRRK